MKVLVINSVGNVRKPERDGVKLVIVLEVEGHEVKFTYGIESIPE